MIPNLDDFTSKNKTNWLRSYGSMHSKMIELAIYQSINDDPSAWLKGCGTQTYAKKLCESRIGRIIGDPRIFRPKEVRQVLQIMVGRGRLTRSLNPSGCWKYKMGLY